MTGQQAAAIYIAAILVIVAVEMYALLDGIQGNTLTERYHLLGFDVKLLIFMFWLWLGIHWFRPSMWT